MANETDKDFYELMELLGMSESKVDTPYTPEERFIQEMTFGNAPRIGNLYYQLKCDMSLYDFLTKNGVRLVTSLKGDRNADINRIGYARLMVEHYLWACHLTRFHYMGLAGLEKERIADIHKVVEMILNLEEAKKIVWTQKSGNGVLTQEQD